jgi:hypothetical protein
MIDIATVQGGANQHDRRQRDRIASSQADPTAAARKRRSRANKRSQPRVTVPPVAAHEAPLVPFTPAERMVGKHSEKDSDFKTDVTYTPTVTVTNHNERNDFTASATPDAKVTTGVTAGTWQVVDYMAYISAVTLAGAAAYFSIRGMVVLFPGAPAAVVAMAVAMETAKLTTAAWLARRWRETAWLWRGVLVTLVVGLAVINATGVYAQLVAAHVGERGASTAVFETKDAELASRIEVAAGRVGDLDKQIARVDAAVAAATAKGKAMTGLAAMEGQRKARMGLAGEREKEAGALAAIKAERAGVAARGHQIETEAAPIVYVAELVGAGGDSERAIRWLIALMVLTCDPLAIALTAAASVRRPA